LSSASGSALSARHHDAPLYRLGCAGVTDTGRLRDHNEDRFGIFPEIGLFAVADGMGGAAAGEVAAQMAIELICEAFVDSDVTWPLGERGPGGKGLSLLEAAIRRANHCIHGVSLTTPACRGMGTTIAAVLVRGQRAMLAHVGDSRIYRLRRRRLEAMTEDHSLFNELVRAGIADPEHPENFAQHNLIMRALGPEPTVEVDARMVEVVPGDTFLLCSDGLCGVVTQPEITAILLHHTNLDEAAEQLITCANAEGGPDNITAVLVRIG